MPIFEVQKGHDDHDPGQNFYEALRNGQSEQPADEQAPGKEERDSAHVTSPEQAALRLLRQRVLHAASQSLGSINHLHIPAQLLPIRHRDPVQWADALWISLNTITSQGRRRHGEAEAHRLLVEAVALGTEETLEILSELGVEGSEPVWTRLSGAIEALRERLLPTS